MSLVEEYLTPYQTTILYDPSNDFDTAISYLSDRAQLVPIRKSTFVPESKAEVSEPSNNDTEQTWGEFITPEVLVLHVDVSNDQLQGLLNRGFKFIHVFSEDSTGNLSDGTSSDDTSNKLPFPSEKAMTFGLEDLYDHIILMHSMCSTNLLEMVISAAYPTYKSRLVTTSDSTNFMRCVKFTKLGLPDVLMKISCSIRGFDEIAKMIIRGQLLTEIDHTRFRSGTVHRIGGETVLAVCGDPCEVPEFIKETFVMFYHIDGMCNWNIHFACGRRSETSETSNETPRKTADDFLRANIGSTYMNNNTEWGILSCREFTDLLEKKYQPESDSVRLLKIMSGFSTLKYES